jgi:hypothetical protein
MNEFCREGAFPTDNDVAQTVSSYNHPHIEGRICDKITYVNQGPSQSVTLQNTNAAGKSYEYVNMHNHTTDMHTFTNRDKFKIFRTQT